jgi:hypothetical protein
MKKLFLTLFITCCIVSVFAADKPNQGVGIQIGWAQPILRLNTPNPNIPKDSLVNTTKLNGLKVGVVYDASYIAGFGSSMGINYTFAASSSPWKQDGEYLYPRSRTTTIYNEVEVFVDWQYKFELAKETYIILYTGPSIQCGLGFTERTTTETQSFSDGNITSTSNDDNRYNGHGNECIKRLNVTWGVGAGFQYKQYFLRGGYDFGILNPYKNTQFIDQTGNVYDRYTRGRFDQWSIKVGMYLWYEK